MPARNHLDLLCVGGVFAIALARNHVARRDGFLLESLSIPWITTTGRRGRKAGDTRGFAVY